MISPRYWKPLVVQAATGVALIFSLSCSSNDDAPGGGRVEYPVDPGPKGSASPLVSAPLLSALPEASVSPAENAILKDCPKRLWSKNVPKRACTADAECGDGFCDRGHCVEIWTCMAYAQPCETDRECAGYLCMDGRCRSCSSDVECKRVHWVYDPKCTPDTFIPGAQECHGVVSGFGGRPAPWVPPSSSGR